jgi:hypothetical protein
MAVTIWTIVNMDRKLPDGDVPPEGEIYSLHWTASQSDQGQLVSTYGSVGLGEPDPNDYIPYEDITEAQALQWLFDTIGSDQVTSIQDALTDQLYQKLNPTTATSVPW